MITSCRWLHAARQLIFTQHTQLLIIINFKYFNGSTHQLRSFCDGAIINMRSSGHRMVRKCWSIR